MSHDPDQPWWLSAPDDDAPSGKSAYDSAPIPPPPPPPRHAAGDSDWLRDTPSGSVPPGYPPPGGSPRQPAPPSSGGAYTPSAPPPPPGVSVAGSSGWSQPFPRPKAAAKRRGTAKAPKPPRRGNGAVRVLLVVFLALLATTIGVAVKKYNPGIIPGGISLPGLGSPPTPTGYAQSAAITFTRTTKTVAAPSSTVIAATDGSGQVKAARQTASVTGAATGTNNASYQSANSVVFTLTITNNTSNEIDSIIGTTITSQDGKVTCTLAGNGNVHVPPHGTAQQTCGEPAKAEPAEHWSDTSIPGLVYTGNSPAGGNTAYYYVPSKCGDPSAAESAARAALQGQLALPAGSTLLFGPSYNYDTSSFACSPAAGTQQANAFTYVQKINATASQTIYAQADVQTYQLAQVKTKIPSGYDLVSSQICPNGPLVGNGATATRATITCPATAVAGWTWTPAALSQLATSIAGADPGTARVQLNQTPGIVAGSVKVALHDGSELPQDAGTITFTVTP